MKKVVGLHPSGQIYNIPCVVTLTSSLADSPALDMHFFEIRNVGAPKGKFQSGLVTIYHLPIVQRSRNDSATILLLYTCYAFVKCLSIKPDYFLGFGFRGLVCAFFLSRIFRKPFIYYSLEFYPNQQRSRLRAIINSVERRLVLTAKAVIFHDGLRRRVYEKLLGVRLGAVAYWPNAPTLSGAANCGVCEEAQNTRDAKAKLMLYAGGLHDDSILRPYIRALCVLGPPWVLVLQSHDGVVRINWDSTVRGLVATGRLVINCEPLSVESYEELLSRVRLGLAVYSRDSINMKYVGLSSGKVGAYWSHGIPIIINRLPFYEGLFRKVRSGMCYRAEEEIAACCLSIDKDYGHFRRGALECFQEYFHLEPYVPAMSALFGH